MDRISLQEQIKKAKYDLVLIESQWDQINFDYETEIVDSNNLMDSNEKTLNALALEKTVLQEQVSKMQNNSRKKSRLSTSGYGHKATIIIYKNLLQT